MRIIFSNSYILVSRPLRNVLSISSDKFVKSILEFFDLINKNE